MQRDCRELSRQSAQILRIVLGRPRTNGFAGASASVRVKDVVRESWASELVEQQIFLMNGASLEDDSKAG